MTSISSSPFTWTFFNIPFIFYSSWRIQMVSKQILTSIDCSSLGRTGTSDQIAVSPPNMWVVSPCNSFITSISYKLTIQFQFLKLNTLVQPYSIRFCNSRRIFFPYLNIAYRTPKKNSTIATNYFILFD